jgi:hypothetical protein
VTPSLQDTEAPADVLVAGEESHAAAAVKGRAPPAGQRKTYAEEEMGLRGKKKIFTEWKAERPRTRRARRKPPRSGIKKTHV